MTAQQRRGRLGRLVPSGTSQAARTPFVLLIVVLLGTGMLGLLLLNASLNEGSFELSELRTQTQELTDEQQALQATVDGYAAPGALAERARALGLVPGGPPAFLAPDGSLLGDVEPSPAPNPEDTDEVPETGGTTAGGGEEETAEQNPPDGAPGEVGESGATGEGVSGEEARP